MRNRETEKNKEEEVKRIKKINSLWISLTVSGFQQVWVSVGEDLYEHDETHTSRSMKFEF